MTADRTTIGVRATRQRQAVVSVLGQFDDFRSAQEIHDLLRQAGESVGLTTVYRTLQALADTGAIDAIRSPDGESRYRLCEVEAHHHHLVCRVCGRTVEVSDPPVEAWLSDIAGANGFSDVTHVMEIFGTCQTCGSALGTAPP